jgi:hypothetical protein
MVHCVPEGRPEGNVHGIVTLVIVIVPWTFQAILCF